MYVQELKARLIAECLDPDTYGIDGPLPKHEGLILRRMGGAWVIEHFERGMRRRLDSFASENEACHRMHELLSEHFRPGRSDE